MMVENSKAFVALKMAEFIFEKENTNTEQKQVKTRIFELYNECLKVVEGDIDLTSKKSS